jgi:hypothetical protein
MVGFDTITLEINGQTVYVVGGDFQEMLGSVRALPKRTWDPERKVWKVDASVEDTRAALEQDGWRLIDNEEEILQDEIAVIQQSQEMILARKDEINTKIKSLTEKIQTYSIHSQSRRKAELANRRSLWEFALRYATVPIDTLVELQVSTLVKAKRLLEEE